VHRFIQIYSLLNALPLRIMHYARLERGGLQASVHLLHSIANEAMVAMPSV